MPADASDLVTTILDVIWDHANFYDDREAFLKSTAPASRGLIAAWACRWYYSEVCNGGHHQFFWNSTGMVWEEALVGFRLFGCDDNFEVLASAVNLFGKKSPSFDRTERQAQLNQIPIETFESLDDRVYDLGDFDDRIESYIHAHPSEFFTDS